MGSDSQAAPPAIPLGVDLCQLPTAPSPDGRPPNFVNPPTLQSAFIIVATIMLSAASTVLFGRLWHNRKSLKLSDWTMVIGFIFNVGTIGIQLSVSKKYRHSWDLAICDALSSYFKIFFAIDTLTDIVLFFPKAAIFLFYMEIFSTTKSIRIGSIIGIIVSFMLYFPAALILSYWAAPRIGETWEEFATTHTARMYRAIPGGVTIGAVSVLIDLYIFVLPLPTIARLNMSMSKRLKVVSLFGTALLGVAASVICLVFRVQLLNLNDPAWQAGVIGIPIIVENNVAIIVGSLPAFTAFLRKNVKESQTFQSLWSRFFPSTPDSVSKDGWQPDAYLETIGGTGKQRRNPLYYELSDSNILQSQISEPGISHVAPIRRGDQLLPQFDRR